MGTGGTPRLWSPEIGALGARLGAPRESVQSRVVERVASAVEQAPGRRRGNQAARVISTGRLNALPRLHVRPINLVVYQDPAVPFGTGDLILGRAWRLDAFSAYPFRT
jgi:hypothetical protein